MQALPTDLGVILVDHGSKKAEANAQRNEVAKAFRRSTCAKIVETAHMELAAPTVAQAFASCIRQGAKRIVVHPYFLAPGRHSTVDIPRMAAEAARPHPEIPFCVSEPLGLDELLSGVILRRVREALHTLEGFDTQDTQGIA